MTYGIGLALVATLMLVMGLTLFLIKEPSEADSVRERGDLDLLDRVSAASRALSRTVGSSVVRIEVERDVSRLDDEIHQLFGDYPVAISSQGSGVVVSVAGHVVTSYHVVSNCRTNQSFHGSVTCPRQIVGCRCLNGPCLDRRGRIRHRSGFVG